MGLRSLGRRHRRSLVAVALAALLTAACAEGPPTSSPVQSVIPVVSETPSPTPEPTTSPVAPTGIGTVLPGEPDPVLTPGATNPAVTQATIHETICVSGWTATVRPPSSYTTGLKREQIAEYGYGDTNLADYEEDHLISLEIGGAPADPENLWPEPYTATLSDGRSVGARVKDQFENRLRDLVCAGELALATAQAEIAHDWIRHWFALSGQAPPPSGSGEPQATPTAATTTSPAASPGATAGSVAIFVRITSLTSPVSRGSSATLRASTVAGAACSIVVLYKSGPSKASGLGPKVASSSGAVSWTWTVGTRTTLGTWPVTVTCSDDAGSSSATRSLRVI